ncbi:MAG: FtsX-like permease family protein [Vicingaceae bacterium]
MRSMQLGSYERMISNALSFYTGHIQVHKEGYWQDRSLDLAFADYGSLQKNIKAQEGIVNVIPRIESFALASFKTQTKGAMVLGIDPAREDQLSNLQQKLVQGAYLTMTDNSLMMAEGLANYLKAEIGDSIVLIGQGYHGSNAAGIYRISGIVKFPVAIQNNQMIYLPLKEAQSLYACPDMITNFTVQLDDANAAEKVSQVINSKLKNSGLEAIDWKFMMPELLQGIELDNVSGKIMLMVLYMVIGFGMFGTFLMMTRERMYELGLMLALGMKKLHLQTMIFLEFLYLSTLGVLTGVLISLPVLIYFYFHPIPIGGDSTDIFEKFGVEPVYVFSLDPAIFIDQARIVFLLTLFLAIYPMLIIYRLSILKALRS